MTSFCERKRISLRCGDAMVVIAEFGAELLSWRIEGKELLWSDDPRWWDKTAPILFPVVGASLNGNITIAGKSYPMPVHGFAKEQRFRVIDVGNEWVHLRLTDNEESVEFYPFSFQLDVRYVLEERRLVVLFDVLNPGETPLPYAIGFHPGFACMADFGKIQFKQIIHPDIPVITPGGFLSREIRQISLMDKSVILSKEVFEHGALVFRNSASSEMTLKNMNGFSINMKSEGFQHLAIWSKPLAPFVCLEAWTSHADWENEAKDFFKRDDIISLASGQHRQHSVTLSYTDVTLC